MNALIFLVPEDIVDVRPRLVSAVYVLFLITRSLYTTLTQILTFVGSLMSIA